MSFVRFLFFFFKQKTAYEMRISDWSSDVCSSDLHAARARHAKPSRRGSIHSSYFKLPATGREILNPPLTDAGSYDPVDKNAGYMDLIGVQLVGRHIFFAFGECCIRTNFHFRIYISVCLSQQWFILSDCYALSDNSVHGLDRSS